MGKCLLCGGGTSFWVNRGRCKNCGFENFLSKTNKKKNIFEIKFAGNIGLEYPIDVKYNTLEKFVKQNHKRILRDKQSGQFSKMKLREQKSRISGSQIAAGGILGAGTLVVVGAWMLIIGIVLSFTIIGAIIGIPIALIGLIMIVGSMVVGGVGVVGGAIKGMVDHFRGKKKKQEK